MYVFVNVDREDPRVHGHDGQLLVSAQLPEPCLTWHAAVSFIIRVAKVALLR